MDEFTVEIPGVKPIELKAYFMAESFHLGATFRDGTPRSQQATTCIIRHGSLTLGTGISIRHPNDTYNRAIGEREAFKKAALDAEILFMDKLVSKTELWSCNPRKELCRYLFSAWRKSRRAEAEKEVK